MSWLITTLEELGGRRTSILFCYYRVKDCFAMHLCTTLRFWLLLPAPPYQHVTNIERFRKRRTQVLYVLYNHRAVLSLAGSAFIDYGIISSALSIRTMRICPKLQGRQNQSLIQVNHVWSSFSSQHSAL